VNVINRIKYLTFV